jgi:hypothetical protein
VATVSLRSLLGTRAAAPRAAPWEAAGRKRERELVGQSRR